MNKELAEEFNQKVNSYRNALLYAARKSDWAAFESRAGKFFDYLKRVEFSERERRFFTIFNIILAVPVCAVLALVSVDFNVNPEMMAVRRGWILAALAISCFELYFFIHFRLYNEARMSRYYTRREQFIAGIEQDIRNFTSDSQSRAT